VRKIPIPFGAVTVVVSGTVTIKVTHGSYRVAFAPPARLYAEKVLDPQQEGDLLLQSLGRSSQKQSLSFNLDYEHEEEFVFRFDEHIEIDKNATNYYLYSIASTVEGLEYIEEISDVYVRYIMSADSLSGRDETETFEIWRHLYGLLSLDGASTCVNAFHLRLLRAVAQEILQESRQAKKWNGEVSRPS